MNIVFDVLFVLICLFVVVTGIVVTVHSRGTRPCPMGCMICKVFGRIYH